MGSPLTYKANSAAHSVPYVFALPWAAWAVYGPALAPRAALARWRLRPDPELGTRDKGEG